MSEKILISVEQNECIKGMPARDWSFDEIIEYHAKRKWADGKNDSLNGLSISQLARILYEPGSFEVVHSFERNDWIYDTLTGDVYKVIASNETSVYIVGDRKLSNLWIRHATPTEIIFAELGRELNEVHQGDVIISIHGSVYVVDNEKSEFDDFISKDVAVLKFHNSSVKAFYPVSAIIKLP